MWVFFIPRCSEFYKSANHKNQCAAIKKLQHEAATLQTAWNYTQDQGMQSETKTNKSEEPLEVEMQRTKTNLDIKSWQQNVRPRSGVAAISRGRRFFTEVTYSEELQALHSKLYRTAARNSRPMSEKARVFRRGCCNDRSEILASRNSETAKLQNPDALRRESVNVTSATATVSISTRKAWHWTVRRHST